ncbi:efflux transporter outer membrane subunit [Sphingobacterium sp. SYP-B4668]|uniref:efflux transporter outer membrane subunit n=1 Tax=Sphingobacterium sp. SYP-B4668 TaxID=2996035 RepID=UPI0022DE35F6|nr:efflux transporter outer membrane subunit [Sphingobacterium sp. SYP-B4668]
MNNHININKRTRLWALATGMVAILAACSTGRYVPSKVELPSQYRIDSNAIVMNADSNLAKLSYRDFFTDPVLLDLIDSSLINNNNLQIALKQIDMATEAIKQAKWGYLPIVTATAGGATLTRPSDNSMNGMMAAQFMGKSYMEDYSTALNISWEADIWGKISGRKEAALAQYLQTQEAANAVRTRLVASVAQGYYRLLMLDLQVDITRRNLVLVDSTIHMTRVQRDLGMTNTLALQQQESVRDQLVQSLPVLKQQVVVQENALLALTGRMPGNIDRRANLLDIHQMEQFNTGIPVELLSLRPDVRSSELELRRSVAVAHVAKVSMYPSLNITAQGGLNAFKASNWFSIPGSLFGMLTGSLTQPILQGRQLKTAYNQAQLATAQAEFQFKESVLQAVGEVSNILVEIESLQDQQIVSTALIDRSGDMVKNAMILFKNDMATYLEVIAAQQSKLQSELNYATIRQQKLIAEVNLYRALGGGVKK